MDHVYANNKRLYTKNFRKVASRAIVSIDYDTQKKIFEIEYTGSRIYHYLNIKKKTWDYILSIINNNESLGAYINHDFKKMVEDDHLEYYELK